MLMLNKVGSGWSTAADLGRRHQSDVLDAGGALLNAREL